IKGIHLRVYSGLNSCGEKDKITSIYLAALFAYKCENFTLGAEYNHILNSKIYNQKIKNCEKTRTIGEPEICPECGNTYILRSGSQKVCENCRKKYTNKKKIKPNADYKAKNYDTCIFYLKKGEKQGIQEYAEKNGMSFNEFVNLSIKTFMENNKENNK
ncbi:MAG: hypothetical protein UH241_04395, partial [Acutalibacteraceae bacterium]|nr:hypothetical protein [Acutalibacteraceae bacterium]